MADPRPEPPAAPAGAGIGAALDDALRRYGLHAALLVAWVATLGSLYFSNVRLYKPCVLCWYQRIFMYPLVVTLALGLLWRDRRVARYVVPPAVLGAAVAVYHVLLQKTDWLPETAACIIDVPCSSDYIYWLGFITIPVLSLTAFALILLFASATLFGPDATGPSAGPAVDLPWLWVVAILVVTLLVFAALWRIDPRAAVELRPLPWGPRLG